MEKSWKNNFNTESQVKHHPDGISLAEVFEPRVLYVQLVYSPSLIFAEKPSSCTVPL